MKHDENKDLRSFSRVGRVSIGDKTLRASKNAIIGIHLWGKIDFLTKYCGWHFIWDDNSSSISITEESVSAKEAKKFKKGKTNNK